MNTTIDTTMDVAVKPGLFGRQVQTGSVATAAETTREIVLARGRRILRFDLHRPRKSKL